MKNEKIRLYAVELSLIIFLLLAMMFSDIFTRKIISIILLVLMIISVILIKTKKIKSINNKQTTILLSAFGIIYIAIIYIIGIFTGFYKATVQFSLWSILNYIIPYIVIIVSSEIIRKTILLKESKKSQAIILVAMVVLDVILWTNIYNLKTVKDYFTLMTFIVFSSIANNLLYNYIIIKYENWNAIIIYRLITTLYMYIIPFLPDFHIFLEAIIRLIVPYIIYIILEQINGTNKKIKIITAKQKYKEIIITTITFGIVAIIIMLISCEFKFGALTIGSGSMTGTINKGDIILYERYDENEQIKTGDIIVFKSEDLRIVHRVVDQRNLGDEIRYYTKGDANAQEDDGYRTRKDVIGKVNARIPYIGYLTLFVNDILK